MPINSNQPVTQSVTSEIIGVIMSYLLWLQFCNTVYIITVFFFPYFFCFVLVKFGFGYFKLAFKTVEDCKLIKNLLETERMLVAQIVLTSNSSITI